MNEKELDWISKTKSIVYLRTRDGREYRYGDTIEMMGLTWTLDDISSDSFIEIGAPPEDEIPIYVLCFSHLFKESDRMYCIDICINKDDVIEVGDLQYVD